MLARFGISSKLAYGLIVQSLLVLFSAIISVWGIFVLSNQGDFSLRFITNLVSLIVCISLLIYSFYGFNAKRNQELFFAAAIVLYIVLIIMGLLTTTLNFKDPVCILGVVTLICAIFFLHEYAKSYTSANYAMLFIVIASLLVVIFNIMGGMPWFAAVKYLIIPVTIGLTYFERTQRGKYQF